MISVKVFMKATNEPLKRTPVILELDPDGNRTQAVLTDRSGIANFDIDACSGKILISGVERYNGRLDGEIDISLWSLIDAGDSSIGAVNQLNFGSNAYPGMETRSLAINGREVLTDSEGYLVDPADWSEDFARKLSEAEGLKLTSEHWEVIRFLRDSYAKRGSQAIVRDMIKHFRTLWGKEKGSNHYLHKLFPRGGPQKQGNRLAGLLRTKGEH
ncbi:MAG: TusE/DsrC/DsvC family sulfur relay protein [Gammaproteobacteria bacterium]|nr:TusE/DsrC/DsvC family sulfur relay protein [Gammaproteobacteria bacterium]